MVVATADLASAAGLGGAGLLALLVAAASWLATRRVLAWLHRRRVLDHPNERSSHSVPTPRGGGIGVLAVALPLAAAVSWLYRPDAVEPIVVIAIAAALAALSWLDDLRGLPVAARLGAHVLAVAAALYLMPGKFLVFQGVLPLAVDRIAAGIAWVWFINLYNFMDGIDGLAGVETMSIGAGLFAVLALAGGDSGAAGASLAISALVVAAAAAGFLALNWHPARVFMGDVGSIALGYLLGWMLLTLAAWGFWSAAMILPAYYLADATITIARRALAGEAVWQAHKKHFYQRAVQRGLGHARVARFIGAGNLILALIALLATQATGMTATLLCFAAAALTVAWMLIWLARAPAQKSR